MGLSRVYVAVILLSWSSASFALRCGTDIIREGDYDFEVLEKCGEPEIRELIGYTLTREYQREFKVERWVYGPWNRARYIMEFEAGVLKRIESRPISN